jgi:hypothetical protein
LVAKSADLLCIGVAAEDSCGVACFWLAEIELGMAIFMKRLTLLSIFTAFDDHSGFLQLPEDAEVKILYGITPLCMVLSI